MKNTRDAKVLVTSSSRFQNSKKPANNEVYSNSMKISIKLNQPYHSNVHLRNYNLSQNLDSSRERGGYTNMASYKQHTDNDSSKLTRNTSGNLENNTLPIFSKKHTESSYSYNGGVLRTRTTERKIRSKMDAFAQRDKIYNNIDIQSEMQGKDRGRGRDRDRDENRKQNEDLYLSTSTVNQTKIPKLSIDGDL